PKGCDGACGHQKPTMANSRKIFALVLLASALLGGCGSSSGGTPTAVAEAFYEEMAAGNIDVAKSLSTPETAEMLSYIAATHCTEMFRTIAEAGASDELVEEGTARVRFEEGGGFATIPLVKLDGEWKVDFATMMKAHMRPTSSI
ncbi:MAG: DUF4878 domain-containing protein, partial [Polyangiales bacterium]